MVDQKLVESIEAHNKAFPDRKIDPIEGQSSRGSVMVEFIKDLQIILGTEADGVLGPNDRKAFNSYKIQKFKEYPFFKIIRWAMWCKGYRGGDVNSNVYSEDSFIDGLHNLQSEAGIPQSDSIDFMIIKSIFSMDAYVLIPGTNGDSKIREMQQKMNPITCKYCGISPCDGLPQQKLSRQIIWYMQCIAKDPNDLDGEIGTKTLENYEKLISSSNYEAISILQLLLRTNGYMANITGKIDEETLSQIRRFKVLMNLDDPMNVSEDHLSVRNQIDHKLICALIRSCGYKGRETICCDTSFIITQEYANNLKACNYSIVGRYISGTVGERSKALSLSEIELLRKNNIELFLIFQENGNSIDYFIQNGKRDGDLINKRMEELHIPHNNVVFVAVDFDIYEYDFRKYIVPYFEELNRIVTNYRIGVYATRLGCKILKEKNLAFGFFVAGASYAFAGNSVPIPPYWHFEQYKVEDKAVNLPIDKDAISLNYKECIVCFDNKESNDYTDLVMSKLNDIEIDIKKALNHTIDINIGDINLIIPDPSFLFNLGFNPVGTLLSDKLKQLVWFFKLVTHGGPWDLKVDESWKKTISNEKMPTFGYPGNTEYFYFQGQYITREDLGNITYGYIGTAFELPDKLLYFGGGAAANGKNILEMSKNAVMNIINSPPYYGDSKEDHENIKFGIDLYIRTHQRKD